MRETIAAAKGGLLEMGAYQRTAPLVEKPQVTLTQRKEIPVKECLVVSKGGKVGGGVKDPNRRLQIGWIKKSALRHEVYRRLWHAVRGGRKRTPNVSLKLENTRSS